MSFSDQLSNFTAADIIAAIGCPRATAYQWKDGTRQPPEWQQPHWLALIRRSITKKSNKTPLATDTSRLAVSRKRKLKGG